MFDQHDAAKKIEAAALPHEDAVGSLILDVADYLGSTQDGLARTAYAEIAFAYVAGAFDQMNRDSIPGRDRRVITEALRKAGLSI